MTAAPASGLQELRTNNLALAFQEVFTVILRTRFFVQRVENADSFRATLRKMISAAVKDASAMGYSDDASKMAIYAMIGFLDESVLNSKDPTFADWARRPLQEEMFGGHFAGEYFFRNVTELLNRPESSEVADVLELHALCLLLGYRGRFAFGDASEIHSILSRIREKINRIRGAYALFRPAETPAAPPAAKRDPWVRRLAITTVVLIIVSLLAYIGYVLVLGQGCRQARVTASNHPRLIWRATSLSENSLMKRVLIGILIFVLYLALVIWGAFALHFAGTKLVLFCVILGLLGALTTVFVLWYLHKQDVASGQAAGPDTPDAINLSTLLREADARVHQANRAGAKSLAALPLIYVIGDENSAKTQTVLQSGLDPELIAGNVFRDGTIVPTQLANLWLAGNCVLVEAGGALLRQPSLWFRLVKATLPARLGSVFSSDSRLPARSVVVCVSIERIMAPSTSEQIRALAQSLNERLRQLSQTLGISLPIYVLFTKLDNVAPFAEYVNRLSEEEVKLPIGSALSLSTGSLASIRSRPRR
jgi:type VI secretion system protein ImpK